MSKVYHVKGPKAGGRRAFLALPTYDSKLHGPCLSSLLRSLPLLQEHGIYYEVYVLGGNCHVDDARNSCVRAFMLSDCTDLVFIDADVGWQPENLVKLIGYDREIVAGVYPKKDENESFPVHVAPDTDLYADDLGLVEVHGAPTGFMKIQRPVLDKMIEMYKAKQYLSPNPDDPDREFPYTILFERTFDQGYRLSGDYAFCFKWRFMGGKIFVDPRMAFVHEGTKEFFGTLGDYWKRIYGVYEREAMDAITALRDTDGATAEAVRDAFQKLYDWNKNSWSATPDLLWTVYHTALNVRGPVLETGSGLSTIALALAAKKTGNKVIALEHDVNFMAHTMNLLRGFGLAEYVDLRYAPIKDYGLHQWYTVEDVPKLAMVLCDGPPRKYSRAGLYDVLAMQITDAIVIADDADDPKELIHVQAWSAANDRVIEIMGEQRAFAVCVQRKSA